MNFLKPDSVYKLENIRNELVQMEDFIIFQFIKRSEYPISEKLYSSDPSKRPVLPDASFTGSFLDYMHRELEILQSKLRRFDAPDETPFFPNDIVPSILEKVNYPKLLAKGNINYNNKIRHMYIDEILPLIADNSVDEEYMAQQLGSITVIDIELLQNLSRRIHFGLFVAESKYRSDIPKFKKLIQNKDYDGIYKEITNQAVEDKILERLERKGESYIYDSNKNKKITSQYLVKIYKDFIIPITKEVEVEYLMSRLDDDDDVSGICPINKH
ncbi:hypothetical protein ACO0SA_003622 [Hanseniaspora valbyensis]